MSVQFDTLKDAAEVRVVRFLFSVMIFFHLSLCQTDLLSAGRDKGKIQGDGCFKEGGGSDGVGAWGILKQEIRSWLKIWTKCRVPGEQRCQQVNATRKENNKKKKKKTE